MAESPSKARPRKSRLTLARRLALLFGALLAVVVAAFGAAAYDAVRDEATLRASQRLESVARELAIASARSAAVRTAELRELSRDSVVQRVVLSRAADLTPDQAAREVAAATGTEASPIERTRLDSLLAAVLAQRYPATDSTMLGPHLLDATGRRRFGLAVHGRDSVELEATVAAVLRTDSIARSALYASGTQMHLWAAAPVKSGTRTIGVIAEHRRVARSTLTEQLIARLTGSTATVYITGRGASEWTTTRGLPVAAPFAHDAIDLDPDTAALFQYATPAGPTYFATAPVANTPWRLVLAQTEASILARPRATLQRLLLIGLLLLGAGTIAAWWLARLETKPLGELRTAADAVAVGDYSRVVSPEGAEETAALADAFNTMSLRISGVHATLAHQNEALQRANEAKARFLAVMSHELRTPLNAIGGHAELVAMGVHGPVTTAQLDALERIGRSKEQLVTLVSDILHYSRLEATPLTLSRQDVRVQHVLDSVRETVADQFERKGVQLTMHASAAVLCADPVRVQQVLINLVTNALQFTEGGGTVDVSAESLDEWTTLRVRDTGSGIPADQRAAIFEPFVQADNSLTRRSGGAGLGLAIVKQLVTAMGGHVAVESEVGVGSTFSVQLPNAVQVVDPVVDVTPLPDDAKPAVTH